MAVCLACRSVNEDSSHFCERCGNALTRLARPEADSDTPTAISGPAWPAQAPRRAESETAPPQGPGLAADGDLSLRRTRLAPGADGGRDAVPPAGFVPVVPPAPAAAEQEAGPAGAGQPVQPPPGDVAPTRRASRRHWLLLAIVGVVLLLLVGGGVAAAFLLSRPSGTNDTTQLTEADAARTRAQAAEARELAALNSGLSFADRLARTGVPADGETAGLKAELGRTQAALKGARADNQAVANDYRAARQLALPPWYGQYLDQKLAALALQSQSLDQLDQYLARYATLLDATPDLNQASQSLETLAEDLPRLPGLLDQIRQLRFDEARRQIERDRNLVRDSRTRLRTVSDRTALGGLRSLADSVDRVEAPLATLDQLIDATMRLDLGRAADLTGQFQRQVQELVQVRLTDPKDVARNDVAQNWQPQLTRARDLDTRARQQHNAAEKLYGENKR